MRAEAAFLVGYAVALVALAAGLEWIGRKSSDPWSSRMLAASRPVDLAERDLTADWPHSEVPRFHQGLAAVALVAAFVLTVANLARHHRPIELVVIACVLALVAASINRVIRQHRDLSRR